jgi:hypothetical protein
MYSYYDLVFFSIMKIKDRDNDTTPDRKSATLASVAILVTCVLFPFILAAFI